MLSTLNLADTDLCVTPHKGFGSTTPKSSAAQPQATLIKSKGKTHSFQYNTRWRRKAQQLLDLQRLGKHLDRRERRLTQSFKGWQAKQQQQQGAA